jgi:hypothetical protein
MIVNPAITGRFIYRFIRIIEKDQAFVIIEEQNMFKVYIDGVDLLASKISQRKSIKTFHSPKVGSKPLFALDETRRLLVIFATIEVSLPFVANQIADSYLDFRPSSCVRI